MSINISELATEYTGHNTTILNDTILRVVDKWVLVCVLGKGMASTVGKEFKVLYFVSAKCDQKLDNGKL